MDDQLELNYIYGDDQAKSANINQNLINANSEFTANLLYVEESNKTDSFALNWNSFAYKNNEIVIVNVHGRPTSSSSIDFDKLNKMNANVLFLLSCNGGVKEQKNNLAVQMLENNNINYVISADGTHYRRNYNYIFFSFVLH